jgi:hypothetical protein
VYLLRSNLDDPRRRLLVKLLAMGGFSAAPLAQALADVLGEKPGKLPPDRSIYRLSGEVTVNGEAATIKTKINPTDTIQTGKSSEIVFVNVDTAYILRESSRMNLARQNEGNVITNVLRYILAKAAEGKSIRAAPFINHTDQELMLIETLVGRQPPFVFPSEDYGGPRKDY